MKSGNTFYLSFVHLSGIIMVVTLALGAQAIDGQTADQIQKAAEYCNNPANSSSPICQQAIPIQPSTPIAIPSYTERPPSITNKSDASNELAVPPPLLIPGADEPSEFQRFASTSVGKVLPIFGASLFERVPSTFAPVERAPVTADYVIGPGDELIIRVWGQVTMNLDLVVDRAGAIYVPQVGNINVAGLEFKQMPGFVRSELSRVFRNFELNVNVGQLRSVQVLVIGQARTPGTYTVSSLSTLVNVLFSSGGPTPQGSMRHIQLRRNDKLVSEVDLYDLLLNGDKSKDARVLPGDIIFIPTVGPQIAIAGSIRTPAIFELRNERTVEDVLRLTGGTVPTADLKRVVLERIDKDGQREVLELSLESPGPAVPVRDADIIKVRPISPRFRRTVTLRGNVANPGRFAWRDGMRLRDVIPDKESLITRSYWEKKNSLGFLPIGESVARRPESTRLSDAKATEEIAPPREPAASRSEMSDQETHGLSVAPVPERPIGTGLARWVPDIDWGYAVIERQNPQNLTTELLQFDLGKLILENDADQNLELRSGDVITIFSTSDIHVSVLQQNRYVLLEGEVNASGLYIARPGETLGQLIVRAGGVTNQAYLYGAEFTRESTRRDQQQRLDQFVRETEKQLEETASKKQALGLTVEESQALAAQLQTERRVLEQLRGFRASGRIVLDIEPDGSIPTKLTNLALENGDRFVIPSRPATVNILGEVYNQSAFLHEPTLRVADYLRGAGGVTRNADKARMYIIRADGSVLPKRGTGPFTKAFEAEHLNPGDSIVVPEELLHVPFIRNLRSWTQVIADFGLGAAAINVLK